MRRQRQVRAGVRPGRALAWLRTPPGKTLAVSGRATSAAQVPRRSTKTFQVLPPVTPGARVCSPGGGGRRQGAGPLEGEPRRSGTREVVQLSTTGQFGPTAGAVSEGPLQRVSIGGELRLEAPELGLLVGGGGLLGGLGGRAIEAAQDGSREDGWGRVLVGRFRPFRSR